MRDIDALVTSLVAIDRDNLIAILSCQALGEIHAAAHPLSTGKTIRGY
jgi:hypothetical protein